MSKKRERTEAKRKKERRRAGRQIRRICIGCGCHFTTDGTMHYHSFACQDSANKRSREANQKRLEAEQDRKHQRLIEQSQGVYSIQY